jgi:hypothetical protein
MENMLLVGLSRQITLERQMDVVANNVANINTTGFKADRSLFEEYLRSPAHEDNFVRADRRVSFVQDRATFHDFAAGPSEQTKNPLDVAIDGNAFLVVQTAAGERYTRDGGLQINNQGQLVTASGDAVLGTSGPIVFQPTDKAINIAADGNISVLEGTAGQFCRRAEAREGRRQPLLRGPGHRRPARHHLAGPPGFYREVERQFRPRNESHDRDHAHLHADLGDAAAAARLASNCSRETRRRSGITLKE